MVRNVPKKRKIILALHSESLDETKSFDSISVITDMYNGCTTKPTPRSVNAKPRRRIFDVHRAQVVFVSARMMIIEWFSKRTGTSFQNGARSKNAEKKLGRERRRVVLKSDLAVVSTNRPRYICS